MDKLSKKRGRKERHLGKQQLGKLRSSSRSKEPAAGCGPAREEENTELWDAIRWTYGP